MAKYEHLSQQHGPPVKHCAGGNLALFQRCRNARLKCFGLVALVSSGLLVGFIAASSHAGADAWLDRVERNLRRIESASRYTEPAGAGSKLATKAHRACIYDSDKEACEKLIWRSPELLPVRDWAVGTAHVKRGELREQKGDVPGAVEDYRDALGYHAFLNLPARIKRLELRLKRDRQRATKSKAEQKSSPSQSVAKSTPASPNDLQRDPRHPIVVVDGWAATVADKDQKAELAKSAAATEPSVQSAPVSNQSEVTADQPSADQASPVSDTVLTGQNGVESKPESVDPDADRISPPTPVRIARTQPSENPGVAARFIPGRTVLSTGAEAAEDTRPAADSPADSAATGVSHQPARHEVPAHAEQQRPVKLQFNVNAEVARSLERVRSKTTEVLTTSALQDRPGYQKQAQQRSLMSLAVMLMATIMLLSTVAVARGWRPSFPTGGPRQQRKPMLSVDDLENLIKNRTAETLAMRSPPRIGHPPTVGAPVQVKVVTEATVNNEGEANVDTPMPAERKKTANGNAPEVPVTKAEGGAQSAGRGKHSDRTQSPIVADTRTATESRPGVVERASVTRKTTPKTTLDGLDSSLLRRVSYGAASTIVVGSGPASLISDDLIAKVDEARRSELLERSHIWDASRKELSGVLNPFAHVGTTEDPLVARQRFNAAFELYGAVFETIFGARFVYDQKVMLRHLMMILHALPNASLKTLYNLLEAPRSLEPLHEALAEVDNVAARLFFTTVFTSDEFSDKADFMRSCLAPVVENDLAAHLCCGVSESVPLQDVFEDGRLVLMGLDPDLVSPINHAVIVRCLLSVMAMQRFVENSANTGEIAVTVYLPNLTDQIGGSEADADFLLSQVKSAGYNVLY